ncbi:MAG: hypothetical protein JOZ69_00900, partial [Myxococcales bacterium]|nr:hypothetical protein [Myxococcales bacterium]
REIASRIPDPEQIVQTLLAYLGKGPFDDDVTVVVVRRLPEGAVAGHAG